MISRKRKQRLLIGVAVLLCLCLTYLTVNRITSESREGKTHQLFQANWVILDSTQAYRLANFERTLKDLQLFGGGEAVFQGGEGFVRFRVAKDGNLVAMVPVSGSIPYIKPRTWIRFFMEDRYYTIRLTENEKDQLQQSEYLQNATETTVSQRGAEAYTFIQAELGSDVAHASEFAESVLTDMFHIGSGALTIYAGDFQKFRWM